MPNNEDTFGSLLSNNNNNNSEIATEFNREEQSPLNIKTEFNNEDKNFSSLKTNVGQTPIDKIQEDLINKYSSEDFVKGQQIKQNIIQNTFGVSNKIPLTNTRSTFKDVYANVGDQYLPKYKNFLPGSDNEDRLAREQGGWERFTHGMGKAGAQLVSVAAGGTIGMVTGLGSWIEHGFDPSYLFTDDFNEMLDKWNQRLNYKLPNYYTEHERNMNFWQSLRTSKFWADELPNGIAFLGGAIISETAWNFLTGGAGLGTITSRLAAKGSRLFRSMRGLESVVDEGSSIIKKGYLYEKAAKEGTELANLANKTERSSRILKGAEEAQQTLRRKVNTAGSLGEIGNTLRFAYTTAGYQGGMEARTMMKEARDNFYEKYKMDHNGEMPPTEVEKEFEDQLNTAGNWVYGLNLALIGATNLAIFGKVFGVGRNLSAGVKGLTRDINEDLFGIGERNIIKEGKLVKEAIKPTKVQRVLGHTFSFTKAPIASGFELGNQNVIRNGAKNWVLNSFSEDGTNNSLSLSQELYNQFSETYGSKEGWNEIGLGLVMGIFGGLFGGKFGEYGKALKESERYAEMFNDSNVGAPRLVSKLMTANQIFEANKREVQARDNNDLTGEDQSRKESMLSSISFHHEFGQTARSIDDLATALELVNSEEVAKNQGVSVEDVEQYKQDVLNEYKKLSKEYDKDKTFADYLLGKGQLTEDIPQTKELAAKSIAFNMAMGRNSERMSSALLDGIKSELADLTRMETGKYEKGLEINDIIKKTTEKRRNKFYKLKRQRELLLAKKEEIEKTILDHQKRTNLTQEQRESTTAELIKLSERLNTLDDTIRENELNLQTSLRAMKATNPFNTSEETISVEDLDNLYVTEDGKIKRGVLKEIEDYVSVLAENNPEKYERIQKLLEEYYRSIDYFKGFNNTLQGLSSREFKPTNFITKVQKWFGPKTSNEYTRDFFRTVSLDYIANNEKQRQDVDVELENEKIQQNKEKELNTLDGVSEEVHNFAIDLENGVERNSRKDKVFYAKNRDEVDAERDRIRSVKEKYNPQNEDSEVIQVAPTDVITKLQERIKTLIGKNASISNYIGNDIDEATKNVPTESEVNRFQELTDKGIIPQDALRTLDENELKGVELQDSNKTVGETFTDEELKDYIRLNNKLANWQIQQGVLEGGTGTSLSDLLVRLKQYKTLPQTNEVESIDNHTAVKVNENANRKSGNREGHNMVQTPGFVFIKTGVKGEKQISHLDLQSFVEQLPEGTELQTSRGKEVKNMAKRGKYLLKLPGQEDKIKIEVGDHRRIIINKEDWNTVKENLNIKFLSLQGVNNSNYVMGYVETSDGNYRPVKSDFSIETTNDTKIPMATKEQMETTSRVRLVVDPLDEYNKSLSDKDIEDGKVNVYYVTDTPDGPRIVGVMTEQETTTDSKSSSNYKIIREEAKKQLQENKGKNKIIDLGVELDANFKIPGHIIFNVENSEGGLSIKNAPLEDNVIQKYVVDAGYVEDGKLTIGKRTKGNVSLDYLPERGRFPVIVVEYAGNKYALPVSVTDVMNNLGQDFTDILTKNERIGAIVNDVNSLLLRNGIDPKNVDGKGLIVDEQSLEDPVAIDKIRDVLEKIQVKPDIEKWVTRKGLGFLTNEAVTPIDFNNGPFGTPKIATNMETPVITTFNPIIEAKNTSNKPMIKVRVGANPGEYLISPELAEDLQTAEANLRNIAFAIGDNINKLDLGKGDWAKQYEEKVGKSFAMPTRSDYESVNEGGKKKKDANLFRRLAVIAGSTNKTPETVKKVLGEDFKDRLKRAVKEYRAVYQKIIPQPNISDEVKSEVNKVKTEKC